MLYPSKYVLTTDLDDDEYEKKCKMVPPLPIKEKSINDLSNPATMHMPITSANTLPERIWQDCIANPLGLPTGTLSLLNNSIGNVPSPAGGALATSSPAIKEEPGTGTLSSNLVSINNNESNPWEFIDPTQKSTCSCTK